MSGASPRETCAPEEEEMDDIGLGAYQDDDEEGGLQGLADRQAPMPKW